MADNVQVYGPVVPGYGDGNGNYGHVVDLLHVKDHSTIFRHAEYNSNTKKIDFKFSRQSPQILCSIDATPFIKDGMLQSVSVVGTDLVFTFNTDAGGEIIRIPIADIFEPGNYYTIDEINAMFLNQDIVRPFGTVVSGDAGYSVMNESTSDNNPKSIVYDDFRKRFFYCINKDLYTNWIGADNYVIEPISADTEPLTNTFFYCTSTKVLWFWDNENKELVPVTVDLTPLQQDIQELMDEVFPVSVTTSFLTTTGSTVEYDGIAKENTLTWTVKRKGANCRPTRVIVTKTDSTGTETIFTDENPTLATGSCPVTFEELGTTTFKVTVVAEGQTKSGSLSVNLVLPYFYGFAADQSALDTVTDNLTKCLNFNSVPDPLVNPDPENHLIVAVPQGKTVKCYNGVMNFPMQEPNTDSYTINQGRYEYSVYFSAHPVMDPIAELRIVVE